LVSSLDIGDQCGRSKRRRSSHLVQCEGHPASAGKLGSFATCPLVTKRRNRLWGNHFRLNPCCPCPGFHWHRLLLRTLWSNPTAAWTISWVDAGLMCPPDTPRYVYSPTTLGADARHIRRHGLALSGLGCRGEPVDQRATGCSGSGDVEPNEVDPAAAGALSLVSHLIRCEGHPAPANWPESGP
jgi:hypothetical protein